MSLQVISVKDGIATMSITGILKESDLADLQKQGAALIDQQGSLKCLVLLENFQGWEVGADWNDMEFQLAYGDYIEKIAFVGEPKWQEKVLIFAAAGYRKGEVRYFQSIELAAAWLKSTQRES